MNIRTQAKLFLRKAVACSVALALVGTDVALAATDLSDMPLASSSTATVRPNVLYVLDDSGSMDWTAMPDEMVGKETNASYRSHLCNTIYYNPSVTYKAPPQLANGTVFPNQSFTAAQNNGYNSGSGTTDLSTSFRANGQDTAQPAYYYVLDSGSVGTGPLDSACLSSASFSNSYPDRAPDSGTTNGAAFRKVRVTSTSGPGATDERGNFANWYSYYRNRLMMMKAATGRAFIELNESYRVGFITINPNSPVTSSKYLKVADFDATHKQNFLDKLYGQSTNGSTPLREALSRAGWIFAGKLGSGLTSGIAAADDPVQYACQQNFTILTTDGYWNGNGGKKLDGSSMDNTDGNAAETATGSDPDRTPVNLTVGVGPRPIWDGAYDSTRKTGTLTKSYFLVSCGNNRRELRHTETFTGTEERLSGGVVVSSSTVTNDTSTVVDISCRRNPTPSLPNPSVVTTSGTTVNATGGGGSSDTLADVAQYYYKTDLRPDDTAWPDKVPALGTGTEDDRATWQHMTTFTLGLGLFGRLNFTKNYRTSTDPTIDFNKIRAGTLFWPDPNDGDREKADDLWHTAVNGRGEAFNATNPDEIVSGLQEALSGVNARVASAAAAATSNLEPVAGDNFAYTASYETVKWQGELQAREIDLQNGLVATEPTWSAAAKLNTMASQACDNRTIHLFRSGAASNLVAFKWKTDSCDMSGNPLGAPDTTLNAAEQAYFDSTYADNLSQWTSMTDGTSPTVDQRTAATGPNLVNFIRGQRGKEGFVSGDIDRLYRSRENILGDIVNAQPLFVRRPFAEYLDTGYAAYKSAKDNRTPMVYVAANDGMLHAFYAGTSTTDTQGGVEAWAFIPSIVLPNLHRLADRDYASLHQFNVDGTPVAGDVYDSGASAWKTILVAGLNKGGKGYYALDVTDPASPKGLWEFKYSTTCYNPSDSSTDFADCNLGYSYGNPVIAKLSSGKWVVFVTSGYNNVSGATGDGQGFLYVLDAMTGRILKKIGTGVGDATTPSGLGKISAWVDSGLTDNTAQRVYGVDLLGNVWRFDVNSATPAVQLLAVAKDGSGTPQSITTKPELAYVGYPPEPHVYVATGRYLGASDISFTQTQSLYAIRDPLSWGSATTPVHANLRTSLGKINIANTTVNGEIQRTGTCNVAGGCPQDDGWFADFPDTGERVNVDIKLQLGTLTVLSNVPQNTACNIGGYSYINFFDYASGLPITGDGGYLGSKLADSLAVGLNILRLPDGKTVAISTTSDSSQRTSDVPVASPSINGRRVSWREIGE